MKLPEFKGPGVNPEILEDGKVRRTVTIVAAVLLVLLLAAVIFLRVRGAGQSAGVKAVRRAGVLRVSVPAGSGTEEPAEAWLSEKEAGLIRDIADQLGVETEFLPAADVAEALSMVRDGSTHLAVGSLTAGSVPETMADRVSVSRAYDTQALCAVTRRGDYSDSTEAFRGRKISLSPTAENAGFRPFPEAEEPAAGMDPDTAYKMLENRDLEGYFCTAGEADRMTSFGKDVQSQLMSEAEGLNFVVAAARTSGDLLDGINQIILIRSTEADGGN